MITLSWLTIVTILAAGLALFDGISRLRGRRTNSILAIAELVFAVLMLLSLFITFPALAGFSATFFFALVLEIILILILLIRGAGSKGVSAITIIALVLNTVVVLIAAGWISIPGLG